MALTTTGLRRTSTRATLAGALLAVTTVTGIGVAAPAAHASTALDYVALGDSYSAGPLDGPTTGNLRCLQSSASYPHDAASHLGAALTDVCCSAADSADVTTSSQYPGVPPQVRALSPSAQLITLTDGGSDSDLFVSALLACGATDILVLFNIGSPCKALCGNTFTDEVAADAPTIRSTFATVRGDAPNAQVYVLGHPDILPSSGGCYPTVPRTNGDTGYLNNLELDLNSTVQAAAGIS